MYNFHKCSGFLTWSWRNTHRTFKN